MAMIALNNNGPPPTTALLPRHATKPAPRPGEPAFKAALVTGVRNEAPVQAAEQQLMQQLQQQQQLAMPRAEALVRNGFNAVITTALNLTDDNPTVKEAAKAIGKEPRELLKILNRPACTAGTHYILPTGAGEIAMTKAGLPKVMGANIQIKVTSTGLNHVMTFNQPPGVGQAYSDFMHITLTRSMQLNQTLKLQNDQYRATLSYQAGERRDNARALESTVAKIISDIHYDADFDSPADEKKFRKTAHSVLAGGAQKTAYGVMHPGYTGQKAVAEVCADDTCAATELPTSICRPNEAKSALQLGRDAYMKLEQDYALREAADRGDFQTLPTEKERKAKVTEVCKAETNRLAPTVYAPKSLDTQRNLKHLYRSDAIPEYKKRKVQEIHAGGGDLEDMDTASVYELQAALQARGLRTTGSLEELRERYEDAEA